MCLWGTVVIQTTKDKSRNLSMWISFIDVLLQKRILTFPFFILFTFPFLWNNIAIYVYTDVLMQWTVLDLQVHAILADMQSAISGFSYINHGFLLVTTMARIFFTSNLHSSLVIIFLSLTVPSTIWHWLNLTISRSRKWSYSCHFLVSLHMAGTEALILEYLV